LPAAWFTADALPDNENVAASNSCIAYDAKSNHIYLLHDNIMAHDKYANCMPNDTRQSLINSAELLLRSRGYAAFSYADLEKSVGIRKASIHHHFPTKEDLGVVIVEIYIERTKQDFEKIEAGFTKATDRLGAFANLFNAVIASGSLPLCGALAAEMVVLPERMQSLTRQYFEVHLQWLEKTIVAGVVSGELSPDGDSRQKACQILSLFEGASFICWAIKGPSCLNQSVINNIVGAK